MSLQSRSRPMRVLMVASEMAPFAKVGGLADVMQALPPALADLGVEVRAMLPLYGSIDSVEHILKPDPEVPRLSVRFAGEPLEARLFRAEDATGKVTVHFVASDRYFDRHGIYDDPQGGEGYGDNAERFLFFCRAVEELVRALAWRPDVVHAHDHQAAALPAWLGSRLTGDPFYGGVGSVFTIHNLGYQGVFPASILPMLEIGPEQFFPMSPWEFYGDVNLMKAAIQHADMVTTVSQRYAEEISTPQHGMKLDGVLRDRSDRLVGILNGVDYSQWDPSVDRLIPHSFRADDLSGKVRNRDELRRRFGLPSPRGRTPIIGIVSRLADQKGFDLVAAAMGALMTMDLQLVVLGTGQEKYHRMFEAVAHRHPDRIGVQLAFDNVTAHLIEAGADMFLMPSRYEPCGLNQMYSLRYGTLPIVRATGGLVDTVRDADADPEQGTGFSFDAYDPGALLDAVRRALEAFAKRDRWLDLIRRAMAQDHSWKRAARSYLDVYERALAAAERRQPVG